ncbi:Fibronectin type III [Candidatus Nanopelagicaceae bacterium]
MRLRIGFTLGAIFLSMLTFLEPTAYAVSTLPSAPTNITQSAIAGGVRVAWSAPSDLATGITGYKLEYSTSGISGTWVTSTTVSGSTFSYDILGLSQTATYVRVTASATSGFGTPGYPWTKLYRTVTKTRSGNDIVYESGYGVTSGDFAPSNPSLTFTRIRYRMEDSFTAGTLNYADVDFYKWAASGAPVETTTSATIAPSIANLQILSPTSGGTIQTNVSDLNVYSSIYNTASYPTAITNRTGGVGRLEIWPWNYAQALSSLTPAGDGGTYDVNDTSAGASGYGSFQVHDVSNSSSLSTVFAWNDHAVTNVDIGFGNGASKSGHGDWTFCGTTGPTCAQPPYFSLTIFINAPITPLVANSTTSISIPSTGYKGASLTITATSNLSGFYTFTSNGKRIAGCYKKATTGSGPFSATCTWKPTFGGFQSILAVFSNIGAGYIGSQAASTIFISKRTTLR